MKIILDIKKCSECPKCITRRTPRSGFAYDYLCSMLSDVDGNYTEITGYVEYESEIPEVPEWCPLALKEETSC